MRISILRLVSNNLLQVLVVWGPEKKLVPVVILSSPYKWGNLASARSPVCEDWEQEARPPADASMSATRCSFHFLKKTANAFSYLFAAKLIVTFDICCSLIPTIF